MTNPLQEFDFKVLSDVLPLPALQGKIPGYGLWMDLQYPFPKTHLTPVKIMDEILGLYNAGKSKPEIAKIRVDALVFNKEWTYRLLLQEWNEKFNDYCQEFPVWP